jgi:hypothetical protein
LECHALEQERAATLAQVTSERDALQRRFEESAVRDAVAPPRAVADAGAPAIAEAPAPAEASEPAPTVWPESTVSKTEDDAAATLTPQLATAWPGLEAAEPERAAASRHEPAATAVAPAIARAWPAADVAADISPQEPPAADSSGAGAIEPVRVANSSPDTAPELVANSAHSPAPKPYVPTSFIDKYRHLLEGDAEPEPSPRMSRPILDEEYLSPAQCEANERGEEDSDEALEAYMSNLMRRVKGTSPAPGVAAAEAATCGTLARFLEESATAELSSGTRTFPDPAADEPEIELDGNGLLRLVRKPMVGADLAALRDLANTSARTAIAQHRQKRSAEAAVTKTLICVMASAASAFLMLTAPGAESPWFWGGCVTLVMAVGSAAQLGVLAWQRAIDRRRYRAALENQIRATEPPAANRTGATESEA